MMVSRDQKSGGQNAILAPSDSRTLSYVLVGRRKGYAVMIDAEVIKRSRRLIQSEGDKE